MKNVAEGFPRFFLRAHFKSEFEKNCSYLIVQNFEVQEPSLSASLLCRAYLKIEEDNALEDFVYFSLIS